MESITATAIAEVRGVARDFRGGGGIVHALRGVDLRIEPGEFVALRGRSGSGKTTLLNILIGLDDPTSGQVFILGRDMAMLGEAERARLRRESIGMMFQNAHLFPSLTALENVEMPLRLARMASEQRTRQALEALKQVGLSQRMRHRGLELSGGEQQRVALARALVHNPRFIVADEPTGNLDSHTGTEIMDLIRSFNESMAMTVVMVTHERSLAERYAGRLVFLADGKLVGEQVNAAVLEGRA